MCAWRAGSLALRSFPTRRSSDLSRARFDSDPDDGREPRNGLVVQRPPKQARFWQMKGVWMSTCSGGPKKDRKSTRLNSSHVATSYAVFCLKQNKVRAEAGGAAAAAGPAIGAAYSFDVRVARRQPGAALFPYTTLFRSQPS